MGNNLFPVPVNPPIQTPIKQRERPAFKKYNTLQPTKTLNISKCVTEKRHQSFSTKEEMLNKININLEIENMFSGQKTPSRKVSLEIPTPCADPCSCSQSTSSEDSLASPTLKKKITYNDYELNFYRNEQEIRSTYFAKLIYKQVLCSQRKPKIYNSIIILDWDDTLLCTSFLGSKNGLGYSASPVLSRKEQEKISTLEESVMKLLTLCVEKGDVYIITNAESGWIEYSVQKYYPKILPILKRINVISARDKYSRFYPNDSKIWKIQTFLDITKSVNSELVTNVICMGDSFIEIEAGNRMREQFIRNQAFVKTIKFRESPKPEELNKQLCLVIGQFHDIYSSIKNLTIYVERKKKMSC